MKKSKLVVGHLMNDQLLVKSVTTSKHLDWLKWLEAEELVEFFGELLKLVTQISEGKKDAANTFDFSRRLARNSPDQFRTGCLGRYCRGRTGIGCWRRKTVVTDQEGDWAVNHQPFTLEPLPRKVENFIKRRDQTTRE